jgi:hypothetical protein
VAGRLIIGACHQAVNASTKAQRRWGRMKMEFDFFHKGSVMPFVPRSIRRLIVLASAALGVAAVVQELKRPTDERTWHGSIIGVPYDFRPPTVERVKERVWNPEDKRIFTPHVFGVGWTLNLYRLTHPGS